MSTHDWPKWEVINQLGERLGIGLFARNKWRQRGVPYRYHLPMLQMAKQDGLDLSPEDLRPQDAEAA